MGIIKKQNELIELFNSLSTWEEKYEYLISLGKKLDPLNECLKTENRMIKGCQSRVWFDEFYCDKKLFFKADADGILPKGIVAILIRVFSGELVIDIMNSSNDFIEKIGFQEFLSPSRSNGMLAIMKYIKFLAIIYHSKYLK